MEKINFIEEYQIFEDKLTSIILNELKKFWIWLKNVEIFKAKNHVNFMLLWFLGNKKVLLKANFFWRSILYLYELYSKSEKKFKNLIKEELQNNKNKINNEAFALEKFLKKGLNTPKIYFQTWNFFISDFLEDSIDFDDFLKKEKDFDFVSYKIDKILNTINSVKDSKINFYSWFFKNLTAKKQKFLKQNFVLKNETIHWDFKANNLLYKENDFYIIDPKIQKFSKYFDLWKFIVRGLLWENKEFYKNYLKKYSNQEQKIILFLWLLDTKNLANSKQRKNEIEILWLENYNIRKQEKLINKMLDELVEN